VTTKPPQQNILQGIFYTQKMKANITIKDRQYQTTGEEKARE
jgi:hypothetical protein